MSRRVKLVLMTAPADVAVQLCRTLLEERLVACGNVVPAVTSVYVWDGAVQEDSESLLVLKTVESKVDQLLDRTADLHPYEVPEILVLDVASGHRPYLDWVVRETEPME